ncbi:MAG: type 1 glutamine amidotransferase [Gammaproteobacteria bacterium]|nr:type 1 glutamine amidotransferase [Gammaproteobacteria bacterium]
MKVHYIQHVPFEGLSSIEYYMTRHGHDMSSTHLYRNEKLPSVNEIDWLIIMGGPMGIYDEDKYNWLKVEKEYIKSAIDIGKTVIGICLGAQLIADALGARVYKNKYREIGWFNISLTSEADDTILSGALPVNTEVFHWHGDTFDIPEGAISLARSDACKNQAFIFDNRIVAFQFHLETTFGSATALIENCGDELDDSEYVQTAHEMLANQQKFTDINHAMFSVLNALESRNT